MLVGGMLCVMMNPAMILPIASRLMGLVNVGLVSLMAGVGGSRGLSSRAKKMIRVL